MAGVAFFDADHTLAGEFTIFPLFEGLAEVGFVGGEEATRLHKVLEAYELGDSEYAAFVMDALVVGADIVRGKSLDETRRRSIEFFDKYKDWFAYVAPTLADLRHVGAETVLVTAEPQFIADGIQEGLGLDHAYSSTLEVDGDGIFTGRIKEVLGSRQKGAVILGHLNEHGGEQTYGFGDSEGDTGMLEVVDNPFCIRPSDGLRAVATEKGWHIVEDPDVAVSLLKTAA